MNHHLHFHRHYIIITFFLSYLCLVMIHLIIIFLTTMFNRSIAACFNDDDINKFTTSLSSPSSPSSSYDNNNNIISELINNIKYSTIICKNQLYDSVQILNKIKNIAFNVLHNILPDLEIAINNNNKNIINKNFNIIKEWVIELTKLNSITCDVNKQSIDQIQQIFMKSTIDQLTIDKSISTSNIETTFRFNSSSSSSSVQQYSNENPTSSTSHQPPLVLTDHHDHHNGSNQQQQHHQQLPRSTSGDAIADAFQKLLQVTN